MNLYLMRHGIAVAAVAKDSHETRSDEERPLTRKGAKRMRQAAEGLSAMELDFERILTSPLRRARQTAEIVAEVLDMEGHLEQVAELAPEGSVHNLLSSLAGFQENKGLLLVGHQPLLGKTASFLLSKGEKMEISLKKGGICCIETAALPMEETVLLRWLLTPKQLRRLAGR